MPNEDQKKNEASEPSFFEDLKKSATRALLGLGALGTIFPLIANTVHKTFGISLEWAFHTVYTFYFLVPVAIIIGGVLRKEMHSTMGNSPFKKKFLKMSPWYVLVNLAIALLSALLFFGLGAPPWTFYIPLVLGVSLSAAYQFTLTYNRARWGVRSKKRTVSFYYCIISLSILLVGGLLVANRGNLGDNIFEDNILEEDNVYTKLEKQKEEWRNLEEELKEIKLLVTRRKLSRKEKTVGKIQYEIKKKNLPEFLKNEIRSLKKEIPVDGKSIDLSPKTFTLLEEVVLTIKSIKEENQKKQLKRIFDKVFYRGLLFFMSILIILINVLLFFRFEQIDKGKEFFVNETTSIKNYIVLIVLLIIPIFRTIDTKGVSLDHPIWPVNLQYIVTGGERGFGSSTRSYPTHYIDRSVNLEGSDLDLTDIREFLRAIKDCTAEIEKNVQENTGRLTSLEAWAKVFDETTNVTLGKVNENIAKTNEVENK